MEALRQRPVAYYKLDQDVLIDSSGYNRPVSVTNRTNGIPTHSDSTRSLILNGVSALTLGSPVFTSNRDSEFTLEADIVPIAQTENNTSQTYYENRITDPLMQTAGYWFSSNATTHPRTVVTYDGRTASRITRTDGGANALYAGRGSGYEAPVSSCVGGEVVTIVFKAMSNVNCTITSQVGYGTATASITAVNQEYALVANQPQVIKRTLTIPSTGAWVGQQLMFKIFQGVGGGVAGDWYQIWDVGWYMGEYPGNYFDGNMPGYKWSGAANNSFSQTRKDVTAVNLVRNPNAATITNFAAQHGTVALETGISKFGTTSVSATRTTTGAGDNSLSNTFNELNPNETCYASVWVYTEQERQLKLEIAQSVSTGTNYNSPGFTTVPANTWTKLTHSVAAGGRRTILCQVMGTNFATGEKMYTDGWLVTGSPNTEYFDGSMSDAGWTGAANNSPSLLYTSQGTQSIISNSSDGLTINGTVLSFSTLHGDGTVEAKCSYDLGERTRTHVTAQHTKRKNTLYVDDEIVAEVDVPELALYAPATTLTSGPTNSGQAVAINNIGIYDRILSRGEIAINSSASAYFFSNDTQSVFQAEEVDVSMVVYSPYFIQEYTSSYPGIMTNVIESFDELVPSEFNGAAVAGTWEFTVPLSLVDNPKTLTNSYVQWSGSGFTVQASLVTDVWFDVVENKDIVQLRNYNGQDKEITFRVTFTEGSVDSYLSMFRFVTFADLTFSKNGFTYTMNSDVRSYEEGIVFEQTEKRGISVGTSFSFKRDATEESPQPVRTIELVVKQTGNSEPTLNAAYSPTAGYTNGEAVNTYTKGAYVIKHVVAPAGMDLTQNATLSGEFDLMSIKLYPEVLTQDQIKQIIATYTGTIKTRINDINVVGVAENVSSTSIYAYDWSTSSSRGQ